MQKPAKRITRKPAKKTAKRSKALGTVPRNKWFDAKKVRVRSTSKGPVVEIKK